MDRTACTEPQCLYSRAIPLLPLWTVRPVQSLSVCTRVHFYLLTKHTRPLANSWSVVISLSNSYKINNIYVLCSLSESHIIFLVSTP